MNHHRSAASGVNITHYTPYPVTLELPRRLTKLKVEIDEDRETIWREQECGAEVKIYTDGSMKDGSVGAAAMMIRDGFDDRVLKVHLGSDSEHEVYEAEALGLQLGLHLLASEFKVKTATIYTDSQAVLRTLESGKAEHIPYAFADLSLLLDRVLQRHRRIELKTRWIPGHEGVKGNERADEAARMAVEQGGKNEEELPKHLRGRISTNPTAAMRTYKTKILEQWKYLFRDSPRRERMEQLDPTFPSLKFFDSAKHLPRRQFATLVQLRLAHYPCAKYLYRFRKIDSPDCRHCGLREESVMHLLIGCEAHVEERRTMEESIGAASRSLTALLTPGNASEDLFRYLRSTQGPSASD